MILFFTELNFKSNILHGDIRPFNIDLNLANGTKRGDGEYDPFITDFDLMVDNENRKTNTDQEVRYKYKFRLPEMDKKIVISTDDKIKLENYEYSKEFFEDVFALGETISQISKANMHSINLKSCKISFIEGFSKQMKGNCNKDDEDDEDDEGDEGDEGDEMKSILPDNRIKNMKDVLLIFHALMKHCNSTTTDRADTALIKEIEESLKSMSVIIPYKII